MKLKEHKTECIENSSVASKVSTTVRTQTVLVLKRSVPTKSRKSLYKQAAARKANSHIAWSWLQCTIKFISFK